MTQLDMLTKEEVKERELSQSMLSHGMLIFMISYSSGKITAKKKTGLEICSMLYGYQIFS